jgi:putrescine aminotransferase
MSRLCEISEEFPQVYKEITGKGLLIGQHFHTPEIGYKVAAGLFKRGVLVSGTLTNAHTIRIEPALTIEQEIIDEGLNRLYDTIREIVQTL